LSNSKITSLIDDNNNKFNFYTDYIVYNCLKHPINLNNLIIHIDGDIYNNTINNLKLHEICIIENETIVAIKPLLTNSDYSNLDIKFKHSDDYVGKKL